MSQDAEPRRLLDSGRLGLQDDSPNEDRVRISYFIGLEPVHLLGFLFGDRGRDLVCCPRKTLTRGQGLVSRAREPKTFWFIVAVFFLAGAVFILSQK